MKRIERPSSNHDSRPDGVAIDMLVLHYTGMASGAAALARLTDPAAKVSAHYAIDEDGTVYALVPEDRRAWHAGVSYWAGATDINARSIGIELVNPGHEFGYRAFAEPQIAALITLCHSILMRHPIASARVLGHSDVAPMRKDDPGELFPWERLARAGIGLFPLPQGGRGQGEGVRSGPPQTDETVRRTVSSDERGERERAAGQDAQLPTAGDLPRYGYDPNAAQDKIITAFQRHFRPRKLTGEWDDECAGLLAGLLEKLPK